MGDRLNNRRKTIYHAAAKLFFTKGYHVTTMREIARAVKVEPPALYHYYPSKQSLLYEILKQSLQDLTALTDAQLESAESTTGKIRNFLIMYICYMLKRRDEAGLTPERRNLNRKQQNELRQMGRTWVNKFIHLINIGVREKVIRPCDARFTAFLLLGSATSIAQWYRRDGSLKANEIAEIFADQVMLNLQRDK